MYIDSTNNLKGLTIIFLFDRVFKYYISTSAQPVWQTHSSINLVQSYYDWCDYHNKIFSRSQNDNVVSDVYFLLIDYILIKFSFGVVFQKFWETEWFALL